MGQKLARPDEYKKAAILLAVRCGTVSRVDACKTYMLSNDEFSLWELAFNDEGIVGLRDRRLSARRRTRQSPSQAEGVKATPNKTLKSKAGNPVPGIKFYTLLQEFVP